jgi:hypothetical protein
VVDTFYVRESDGGLITDQGYKDEVVRAILFALGAK